MGSAPQETGLFDALVVGAGPAGLSAAMYLARYRRRVLVVHDGCSRTLWVPRTRNVPGFPEGIIGGELIDRMTRHAVGYGARIQTGRVMDIGVSHEGGPYLATLESGAQIKASGVILATGVTTHLAALDAGDHEAAVRNGVLRYCPICDGFEHTHERIAVLGSDFHGAAEAMFLRQYSGDVTLIPKWRVGLTDKQRRELEESGVEVVEGRVIRLEASADSISVSIEGEADPRRFDILYPAFGSTPRSELAAMLGPFTTEEGCLPFAAFSEGLLPGFYGAGDVVAGLDQISIAMGQGAMAATRLHNWLRETEGHVMADTR